MLKSLGSLLWGDADPTSAKLPAGQLYRRKANTSSIAKQLIFRDAQATIRRTSDAHQYQMVVERVYEEGEEALLRDQGIEADEDLVFLLSEELRLHHTQQQDDSAAPALVWRDLNGKPGDVYVFIVSEDSPESLLSSFERATWKCMFERLHKRPHTEASEEDLSQFSFSPSLPKGQPNSPTLNEKTSNTDTELPTPLAAPTDDDHPICQVSAQLYLFNPDAGTFQLQSKQVNAKLTEVNPFTYWIYVEEPNRCWLRQQIEPGMNAVFNREHRSFIWCYYAPNDRVFSWSLRFPNLETEREFSEMFGRCAYETMNRTLLVKANKLDQKYLIQAYEEDAVMTDADTDTDSATESNEHHSETDESKSDDDNEDVTDEENDEEAAEALGKKAKNSQLAVGYKHDRSFVVRGDKIGVFKHTDDDRLKFSTAITGVATASGEELNPKKIMLHEEESAMIFTDPNHESNLYRMDLEYGKVVEEWKIHDDIACTSFTNDEKYSQMTPAKTFVGLSHNSVFRVDPRLSGQKIVEEQHKQYASRNNFTCVATTKEGLAAVGNEKGEIRLFNKLGINAKAALPALGDPIFGIDITNDGRWLLATCQSYLLLVDCWNQQERASGFIKGFSKERKPVPKRLQLKPEHVAYMGIPTSFTVARFNTGPDELEKAIVTSTGPYVIIWNFRRVKQGRLYDYQIRDYNDHVVADNFKFGQDRNIIVTLPDDVQMANKRTLAAPKKLLQTQGKSRSNIVNAPY